MDNDLLFQLDALKRTVDRTAMDLESTRSAVTQLKKDVVDKTNRSGSRFVLLSVWQNLSLTSFVTSSVCQQRMQSLHLETSSAKAHCCVYWCVID